VFRGVTQYVHKIQIITHYECSPNIQRIPNYLFPRWNDISAGSGAHREWSLLTQGSTV
jgi:hypothetical protein